MVTFMIWMSRLPSRLPLSAATIVWLLAASANAQQQTTYDVKTINFDLWCQEQANLPPDRCDRRLPEDEQRFEAFRATIEKYELSHLQDKERERNFDKNVLHNDPIDQPLSTQNTSPDTSTKTNP
jgi:hypothetical protein